MYILSRRSDERRYAGAVVILRGDDMHIYATMADNIGCLDDARMHRCAAIIRDFTAPREMPLFAAFRMIIITEAHILEKVLSRVSVDTCCLARHRSSHLRAMSFFYDDAGRHFQGPHASFLL